MNHVFKLFTSLPYRFWLPMFYEDKIIDSSYFPLFAQLMGNSVIF